MHDQQEQIVQVEDHIMDAAANARAGVDHIQQKFPYCGNMESENRSKPPRLRTGEEFRWTMPFETMGEDIKEVVQKDILGLGSDIISLTSSRRLLTATRMLQCASTEDLSGQFTDDSSLS